MWLPASKDCECEPMTLLNQMKRESRNKMELRTTDTASENTFDNLESTAWWRGSLVMLGDTSKQSEIALPWKHTRPLRDRLSENRHARLNAYL